MLEKAFCSNIAPSLSSGNHLFYKAEYMGQSCPNQVWAITFDWGALATWNKHFWTAFWRLFSGISHLPGLGDLPGARCRHLAPEFSGARCSVSGDMKGGQVGYPWKGLSKCSSEMLISFFGRNSKIKTPCTFPMRRIFLWLVHSPSEEEQDHLVGQSIILVQ